MPRPYGTAETAVAHDDQEPLEYIETQGKGMEEEGGVSDFVAALFGRAWGSSTGAEAVRRHAKAEGDSDFRGEDDGAL